MQNNNIRLATGFKLTDDCFLMISSFKFKFLFLFLLFEFQYFIRK